MSILAVDQLLDLDQGLEEEALTALVEVKGAPLEDAKVLKLCESLVSQVHALEGGAAMEVTGPEGVGAFLGSRGYEPPPGEGLGSAGNVLTFLATELQAARLIAAKSQSKGTKGADRTVETLVAKIAGRMGVELKGDGNLAHTVASIENAVDKVLAGLPKGYLSTQEDCIIKGVELSPKQKAVLEDINAALQEDFTLRRRMLLKRLDVTLQSFLWADKAQGIESDIVATVNAKRESMRDAPPSFTPENALTAPQGVMFQQACKITQERGEGVIKGIVKTVIIGAVPDRGGRANEMRPSKVDVNPYGGGGFRGGGGGGGGRRGGGDGGGGRGGGGGGWRGGGRGGGGGGGGRGGGGGGWRGKKR